MVVKNYYTTYPARVMCACAIMLQFANRCNLSDALKLRALAGVKRQLRSSLLNTEKLRWRGITKTNSNTASSQPDPDSSTTVENTQRQPDPPRSSTTDEAQKTQTPTYYGRLISSDVEYFSTRGKPWIRCFVEGINHDKTLVLRAHSRENGTILKVHEDAMASKVCRYPCSNQEKLAIETKEEVKSASHDLEVMRITLESNWKNELNELSDSMPKGSPTTYMSEPDSMELYIDMLAKVLSDKSWGCIAEARKRLLRARLDFERYVSDSKKNHKRFLDQNGLDDSSVTRDHTREIENEVDDAKKIGFQQYQSVNILVGTIREWYRALLSAFMVKNGINDVVTAENQEDFRKLVDAMATFLNHGIYI